MSPARFTSRRQISARLKKPLAIDIRTYSLDIINRMARRRKLSVYLVGGFWRDYLLGRPCRDLDFAVPKDGVAFARSLARGIKGAFVLLDDEHGCARVVKKKGGRIFTFDFADFRCRGIRGDVRHRDFTINALAAECGRITPEAAVEAYLNDYVGGLEDLSAGCVRLVSATGFREDPLRLMRAYSLQAQLGFSIERGTLARLKKEQDLIRGVARERVRDELFKILASPRAAAVLGRMDRTGLLAQVLPQVTVMYGCRQGTYHHLDVWPHSLETVRQLEMIFDEEQDDEDIRTYIDRPLAGERRRRDLIKLAALLHDIGKPATRKKEADGRLSFHAHERVGQGIVREVAKMLKLSTRERRRLEEMVLYHLRPGYLSNFKQPSRRMIFRYFRDTGEEAVSVLLLSLADQRSTRGPLTTEADQRHHEAIVRQLIRQYFSEKKKEPFVRLINGHDLIRRLKLKPSPLFSTILREVEERQALGKIKTKQQALAFAKEIAEEKS